MNAQFNSILSLDGEALPGEVRPPKFFHDLLLDLVVEAIVAGRQEYDLAPLFCVPLADLDAVAYRQEVMREIEGRPLRAAIGRFAERMRTVRQRIPAEEKRYFELEKQRWFLAAVEAYTDAVDGLLQELGAIDLGARGLRAFRAYLGEYAASDAFRVLATEAREVASALAAIRYCVLIRNHTVVVRQYNGECDYSIAIEETFRKFQQGGVTDYRYQFKSSWGMNHIEAQILDRVALLYPNPFDALARFYERHSNFIDSTIARFDREIQFYAAYLDYVDRLRRAGLSVCYPQLSARQKDVAAYETFDLALADKLLRKNENVICNDFFLEGAERIFVVTGPNQGGKTTFARTFGQLHFLASLGVPVPGREARLFLCDQIFTHFEREEDITTLCGKLADDLLRVRQILERATPNGILILNEVFSSTTYQDGLFLAREVLELVTRLGLLTVCVTFFDELAALSENTVSLVAAVDPGDPARRTFKIERRRADGLAYALALAEKHRVTGTQLLERIGK